MMYPESSKVQLCELVVALRTRVEHDAASGIEGYPPEARPEPDQAGSGGEGRGAVQATDVEKRQRVVRITGQSGDLFLSRKLQSAATLEDLREEIGDCRRCKLAEHRTNIVFGVGNPDARIVFVGEGPGHDEDLQAEPFVGRAGRLLTEIITKGMRLRREDVYIANVIKCRPPGNRNPEPDEVASCEPFLQRQIEIIRPRVIVALGTFAAQTLLRTRTPISRLRGQWHDYHGIRVMATFHPAYLLRNPHDKRLVWEDIKAIMREIGLRPEEH
jgi:uracil-DNA glycosylase family 4